VFFLGGLVLGTFMLEAFGGAAFIACVVCGGILGGFFFYRSSSIVAVTSQRTSGVWLASVSFLLLWVVYTLWP